MEDLSVLNIKRSRYPVGLGGGGEGRGGERFSKADQTIKPYKGESVPAPLTENAVF